MARPTNIEELLAAGASKHSAELLVAWADATRQRIMRGDMMLGILSFDDAAKIPVAYKTAADCGDRDAILKLAWWYAFPALGNPDVDAAQREFRNAIDAGTQDASLQYVQFLWFCKRDRATEDERHEAYQLASSIVHQNPLHAKATYFLGMLTTHGFGVDPSPEVGFGLQQKAAELGNTDAMFELYVHYAQGLGVPVDEVKAIKACQLAADGGHSRAMYNLGAYSASGRGMVKDIPLAIEWYEKAANAGNASAMAGLAVIYATGDGVQIDREYADEMFNQASYCGLDVSKLRVQVGM